MAIKQFLSKAKKLQEQQHHPRRAEEKRSEAPMHDETNWLVSYADMMTLLCGFFIMLFSMAHLDEKQYEKVKESVAAEFGGKYKNPNEDTAKFVTQVIDEMGLQKDAVVRTESSGVAVTFQSTLFFDTLSSEVKKEGALILDKLIAGVADHESKEKKKYRVVVEGHTDSRPITSGPFPSNWELSAARASRVVRMFLERGFSPDHLTAIGYADTYPVTDARLADGTYDDQALARNRRVVVRIMPISDDKSDTIPLPNSFARMPASASRAPASVSAQPRPATAPLIVKKPVELPGGPSPTPAAAKPAEAPHAGVPEVVVPVAQPPKVAVVPEAKTPELPKTPAALSPVMPTTPSAPQPPSAIQPPQPTTPTAAPASSAH
jgi:chemotaxis protein MotB